MKPDEIIYKNIIALTPDFHIAYSAPRTSAVIWESLVHLVFPSRKKYDTESLHNNTSDFFNDQSF